MSGARGKSECCFTLSSFLTMMARLCMYVIEVSDNSSSHLVFRGSAGL